MHAPTRLCPPQSRQPPHQPSPGPSPSLTHRASISSTDSASSSSAPASPIHLPFAPASDTLHDAPSEQPWNLVAYHVPWGSAYQGYKSGTLPGPDGPCIFLRSPTPTKKQRTSQACEKCRERKAKCSGTRPVCARCDARGHVCIYASLQECPSPSPQPTPPSLTLDFTACTASDPSRKDDANVSNVQQFDLGAAHDSLPSDMLPDVPHLIDIPPPEPPAADAHPSDFAAFFQSDAADPFPNDAAEIPAPLLYDNSLADLDAYHFPPRDAHSCELAHPHPQSLNNNGSVQHLAAPAPQLFPPGGSCVDVIVLDRRTGGYWEGSMSMQQHHRQHLQQEQQQRRLEAPAVLNAFCPERAPSLAVAPSSAVPTTATAAAAVPPSTYPAPYPPCLDFSGAHHHPGPPPSGGEVVPRTCSMLDPNMAAAAAGAAAAALGYVDTSCPGIGGDGDAAAASSYTHPIVAWSASANCEG